MKNELEDLRLLGDKFELWDVVSTPPIQLLPKKLGPYSRFKLQISETSDFSICVATVRPDPVVDGSALLSKSDEIEVKIEELEDGLFEVNTCFSRRGIDEFRRLNLLAPPSPRRSDGLLVATLSIEWNDGSKWVFSTSESAELQEVMATHLRKWKSEMRQCVARLKLDWECCKAQFESGNESHQAKLKKLWGLVLGDDEDSMSKFTAKGPEWKSMGFQRDDPTSDFRGMGILGLEHLLYIAEHRRERFRQIMERHKSVGGRIENSYPLASAGINVTNMLIGILTITPSRLPNFHDSASEDPLWSSLLLPFLTYCGYQPDASSHVLEEIYCEVLILLDRTFEAQNAGYMDFPRILESTKKRLLELLARKPRSLATLRAWFDQLNLGFQQQ